MGKIHLVPDWHASTTTMPQYNDTVHQARLFLGQGESVNLILLDFLPRLRTMMHVKRIEQASYWSFFDVVQAVGDMPIRVYGLQDFTWPKGAYFVEMATAILVYVDDRLYARVTLDDDGVGQIVAIKRYENRTLQAVIDVDDRGFVSRVTYMRQGMVDHVDYLAPNGQIALTMTMSGDQVTQIKTRVAWQEQHTFKNLQELRQVVLATYLKDGPESELIIESLQKQSPIVAPSVSKGGRVIYSYQKQHEPLKTALQKLNEGAVIVSDNDDLNEQVFEIPTFATTLDEGVSQESKTLDYYWALNDNSLAKQQAVFEQLVALAVNHPNVRVIIDANHDLPKVLLDMIVDQAPFALDEKGQTALERRTQSLVAEELNIDALRPESAVEAFQKRFIIVVNATEERRDELMAGARLLIDLGSEPDRYLQTLALTKMMPQINDVQTKYMIPEQNGLLIQETAQLTKAIQFYQENMNAWSQAKQSAYTLGQHYYEERLWKRWQTVFQTGLSQAQSDVIVDEEVNDEKTNHSTNW
jgi:accessory secretory protein Asp1